MRDHVWWSNARRSVLAGLLVVGSVSVAPAFASESSEAPTAKVSAEVECDGTVSWTVSSRDRSENSNPDVRLERSVDGAAAEEVGQGALADANRHSFSGSFEWPRTADRVVLRAVAKGRWGGARSGDARSGSSSRSSSGSSSGSESGSESAGDDSVELERPSDCDHRPEVGESVECHDTEVGEGEGRVTVTLSNPAGPFGATARFRVHHPDGGSESSSHEVKSGGHDSVSFDHIDDGDHTVDVEIDGERSEHHFSVDCDHAAPSVEQSQACVDGAGSITVVLVNNGGESVTFRVEHPVTHEAETVAVAASSSTARTFVGLANGMWVVPVHVGAVDLSRRFEVKCGADEGECADHPTTSIDDMRVASASSPEDSAPETSVEDSAPETSVEDSSPESSVEDSAPESSAPEREGCEPHRGDPVVNFTKECVDHDGQVALVLSVVGGEESIEFEVNDASYEVKPGTSVTVVIAGLTDGDHVIPISADDRDLSVSVTVECDLPPTVSVSNECVAFDGSVSLLLANGGDDRVATFTVNGIDHVVAPGASTKVTLSGLADGTTTVTLSINGVAQPDITVSLDCDPVLAVEARCNTVSVTGAAELHWFTITNTEAVDVTVSWPDGSVLVPAGASRVISSTTPNLSIDYAGVTIASASASATTCSKQVTFDKQLIGAPATSETYTVTVWRLVDGADVPVTSFDIVPGTPVTITLPSTLDPAGIVYKVVETAQGSASTSVVSPSTLTLTGDQGATVSVTVTNGYASVRLAKTADVTTAEPGGFVTYDVSPTNTGGLTLDPVQVSDRLPNGMIFIKGSVAGGAGSCSLTDASPPQLVTCTLTDPLPAGATAPTVTLTVQVEWGTPSSTTLYNTAKVVGVFGGGSAPADPPGAPSCTPAVAGAVCALSPSVQVTVTDPPPTTTTTVPPTTVPPTEPPVTTVPPTVDPCSTASCPPRTDPPVTTVPPTDPPVTTVPPVTTTPPTTVPPTDPPVTTVPPVTTTPPTTVPPTDPPVTTVPPVTTTPPTTVPPTDPPVTTAPPTTDPSTSSTFETTTSVAVEPPEPSTTAEPTTTLVTATTPAPTTTTKEQSGGLPSTGGDPAPMLLFAVGALCLGFAMVLTRRRLPNR